MDAIKCGRRVYELVDGDTVMDNGACYQLISRTVRLTSWSRYSPIVSKAAFEEFKNNPNVQVDGDHEYGPCVTLYRYTTKLKES